MSDQTEKGDTYAGSGLAASLRIMHENGALNDGEYAALNGLARRLGEQVASDVLADCGRSVARAYRTGMGDARRQIAEWADEEMQTLPEWRTGAAHGKAELLRDLQGFLAARAEATDVHTPPVSSERSA